MSEVVGTAIVEVVGNLKPLEQQIAGLGPQVSKALSAQSKGGQALAVRSGVAQELQRVRNASVDLDRTNEALVASEARVQESMKKTGHESKLLSSHFSRVHVAGVTLRSSYVAVGAAALIAGQALHRFGDALVETGNASDSLDGRLKVLAGSILKGDFFTAAQKLGESAALLFQAGAQGADEARKAAEQHEQVVNRALAQAKEYIDLQDKITKATGQTGTAEGAVKYQLEQQLRILKAQLQATPRDLRKTAFAQLGVGDFGAPNQRLARLAARSGPTSKESQRLEVSDLNLLRAEQTKATVDDQQVLKQRRNFLKGIIARVEDAGATTVAAKNNLKTLYSQLDSTEGQISTLQKKALQDRQQRLMDQIQLQQTQLQIEEANARGQAAENAAVANESAFAKKLSTNKKLDAQTRAGYALQAAQLDKQIYESNKAAAEAAKQAAEEAAKKREEERKQALADAKAARERALGLREARLQLRLQRADLTVSTSDNKAAERALIKFYGQQAAIARKSGALAKAVEFQSQKVSAQLALKNLGSSTSGGATTADFFKTAAQQFGEFGSNIASRSGILSGQDARGAFAGIALRNRGNATATATGAITGAIQQTGGAALTQLQIQTHLLAVIANGVRRNGTPGAVKDRQAINNAREHAFHVGSN